MAYTKSPTSDTYSSEQIDLTKEIATRAGNYLFKDEDYTNVIIENVKSKTAGDNRTFIMKRAGTEIAIPVSISSSIRGFVFWVDQNEIVYCCGSNLYIYNILTQVHTTKPAVFGTSSGDVGLVEYQYDNGTTVIIATDGTTLIQLDTALVVTTCVDADLPVHLPYPIYLDGYIFVAKINTGDIYGSDLNNPMSWDPTNFITAELEADNLVYLDKINNYLVAFGKETIEYFWDAGNATGSPLQRNDTPIKYISYVAGATKAQNNLYFIGRDRGSALHIYKMSDFKVEPIETPSITRYLNSDNSISLSLLYGNIVAYQGHTFYVVVAGTRTYCYDLDSMLWTKLAYQNLNSFAIYKAFTFNNSNSPFQCYFNFRGTDQWSRFNEELYQDDGVDFSSIVVTDSVDFGTMNRKTMHRLTVQADRPPIDADILVQWSDDDYQHYNAGVLVNLNQDLPCARQLGSFRQRAFRLTFTNNTLMRLQNMQVDINKGSS